MARHPRATIPAHAGFRGDHGPRRRARARPSSTAPCARSRTSGEALDAAALAGDPPDADALVAALREHASAGRRHRAASACSSAWRASPASSTRSSPSPPSARPPSCSRCPTTPPARTRRRAGGAASGARARSPNCAACCPRTTSAFDLVALRGAALVPAGGAAELTVGVEVDTARAPSPRPLRPRLRAARAAAPAAPAAVGAADLSAERAHERGADRRARGAAGAARRARRATAARARQRRPGARERGVKVAFLVNDLQLAGGVGVVVAHARQLHDRHGFDVTLVLAREQEDPHWSHEPLEGAARRLARRGARRALRHRGLDLVGDGVLALRAARRALRVLRAEPRGPLLPPGRGRPPRRARWSSTCRSSFITEARWIADTLAGPAPERAVPPRAQRDRQARLRAAGAARAARRRAAARPRRGQRRRLVQGRQRGGGRRRRR